MLVLIALPTYLSSYQLSLLTKMLIFGIFVSTLLTLVVIPVLYYAFGRRAAELRAGAPTRGVD